MADKLFTKYYKFLVAEFFLPEKYKQEIDRLSAKMILEQYLNNMRH